MLMTRFLLDLENSQFNSVWDLQDELAVIFAEHDRGSIGGSSYQLACCDGLAMDLLISISRELKFEIDLYLVPDGYFGSRSVSQPSLWTLYFVVRSELGLSLRI
jgi:hypothetical protein